MKKLLVILLSLCLMCGMLTACGGNDNDGSSATSGGDTAEVVDIADYEGVWKTGKVQAAALKISAADSSVTTYAENGYPIATFPCVATADGLALKMGTLGEVTVKVDELTVTTEPMVSDTADIKGTWKSPSYAERYITFDSFDSAAGRGDYRGMFQNEDYGTYVFTGDKSTVELNATKNLMAHQKFEIVAGGKVLSYADWKEVFVEETYFATAEGKALGFYYTVMVEDWQDANNSANTAKFDNTGKFILSGEAMGIWYPTENGVSVEYTDGTVDKATISDGSFTLKSIGTTFNKVAR